MRVILLIFGVVDNIIEADSIERAQAVYPTRLVISGEGVAAEVGDLYDGTTFTRPAAAPATPQPLTRLEFLRRFTAPQRIAIRAAAATDPIISDALQLLDLAQEVRLDDPDTLAFTGYLVMAGLITAADRTAILDNQ